MAELDDIIHQPLRLRIMAALNALPTGEGLEFSRLKKMTGATDGNLGAHIETLAKAGYVGIEKAFVVSAADHRGIRGKRLVPIVSLLRPEGVLCDRQWNFAGSDWRSHEDTFAGFWRPRTRTGVEDCGVTAGDKALVRARQCRHRP
jgi:hypothetical protein